MLVISLYQDGWYWYMHIALVVSVVLTGDAHMIKIATKSGQQLVNAQYLGRYWAVNLDFEANGKTFTVTHIPTGKAFCTGYESIKIAKHVAQELDRFATFETEDGCAAVSKTHRDRCRSLWSLSTITAYGKDYNAVSALYPQVNAT